MFGIEQWTFSTLSDTRTHTPCTCYSKHQNAHSYLFWKKIAPHPKGLGNMVKIILYLCQFWTRATTLASCCRQKIKSWLQDWSYSATVYNSRQTRVTWHSRGLLLITEPGCLELDQPDTEVDRGCPSLIAFRTKDGLAGAGRKSALSCLGVHHISLIWTEEWQWAVAKMNREERNIKTRSIIITNHPHSGGGDTEDRGEDTNKYLFCNKCSTFVT